MTSDNAVIINEEVLDELLGKAVTDAGATFFAPLTLVGHELGLYRALAESGPATSTELAEQTGTAERYVREWLRAHAASGYVDYDAETDRYAFSPEQAMLFADPDSPAYVVGNFQTALAAAKIEPTLTHAFRTGEGIGWGEHDHALFHSVEQSFRPSYLASLATEWIPALDGVEEKLRRGARVADIGCGLGASSIILAQAFPEAEVVGFDVHEPSIATAHERAAEAGVAGRVRFEVGTAKGYAGNDYDLVMVFDALHDMGDPVGAATHVRETLAPDGTWMIVEPYAEDRVQDNLHPVGRLYYSASTLMCVPCSLDQEVAAALGAQAGEARIGEVVQAGGFTRFRRAAETPFNLVFEAKP